MIRPGKMCQYQNCYRNSLWKFNTPWLYLPEDSLTWASMLDRRSIMPMGNGHSVVRDTELSVTVCGLCWQTDDWRLSAVWGPERFTTLFTVIQTTSTSSLCEYNCIMCQTFISVCGQPPRSTQPGHPLVGRCNEYQPKGGDALQLGSKGRYGSCVGGR